MKFPSVMRCNYINSVKKSHLPQDTLALRAPETCPVKRSAFNLNFFKGINFFITESTQRDCVVIRLLLNKKNLYLNNMI